MRLAPGTIQIVGNPYSTSLLNHLSSQIDQELHAGIAVGPPRANRKPVLQLVSRDGEQVAFAKVGVNDLTSNRVIAETEALRALGSLELESLVVPELLRVPAWGTTQCVVTRPVRTETSPGADPGVRGRALRALVEAMNPQWHVLATSPWWLGLTARLDTLDETGGAETLRRNRLKVEQRAGDVELLHGAAHGDWSPWNTSTQANRVVAWDWERFATRVPVGLDALHYATQEQVRVLGHAPRDAVGDVWRRSNVIVQENGARNSHGHLLFILYLLDIGERFLTDRQEAAGSRRGPLTSWLIPALEEAVADLGQVDT